MTLTERLKAMDGAWQQAKPMLGSFDLPPDGDYQAVVDRFDFIQSQKNQRYYLKTELRVVGGDSDGHPISTLHDMEDPERLAFLKTHLHRMGLDDTGVTFDELPTALNALVDTPVEIAVKTSQNTNKDGEPYRNVYVNRALGPPLSRSDVTSPNGSPEGDADIPF